MSAEFLQKNKGAKKRPTCSAAYAGVIPENNSASIRQLWLESSLLDSSFIDVTIGSNSDITQV